ncbi:MAG TPA: hypothetical protein VMO26_22100 [Vicinamibacterales bacterium]|nr:hypothetical protein [Vicinamibacterales bacterium]
MVPLHITFPGQEIIPGLESVPATGEPAFLKVEGNCPIIISAPHAGSVATTPAGAKAFGERRDDPNVGGTPNTSDDVNTLFIAFGLIRTLSSHGFVPHTAINLVSRRYVDVNRTWERQQMWQDSQGAYRPGDESKSAAEFPRVAEFDAFRRSFYQDFHDTLRRFAESQHPNGWLFDVHGTSLNSLGSGFTLQIVTTQGFTARRDVVYDSAGSLHHFLLEGGLVVHPAAADPGDEAVTFSATGEASLNLISGGRYGAQNPPARQSALPEPGAVTPGPQTRRVHGVQFEIDGSLRHNRTAEELESVGVNLGNAIYRSLLTNGLLSRAPTPRDGENAVLAFTVLE